MLTFIDLDLIPVTGTKSLSAVAALLTFTHSINTKKQKWHSVKCTLWPKSNSPH